MLLDTGTPPVSTPQTIDSIRSRSGDSDHSKSELLFISYLQLFYKLLHTSGEIEEIKLIANGL